MSNETLTREYTVERLTATKLKDIEALYNAVYGRSAPAHYFETKYNTAYTGHEFVGFVAYNNERTPVAFYGVIPCFLQHGNEKILAAQSADTMTHPQFRYKGMFVELSNICFSLCRELGIRIIFGFPNQNSYHGAVNKLGWKLTHTVESFIMPVAAMPLASVASKTKMTQALYARYKKLVLKRYLRQDKLIPNSMIKEGWIGVRRDEDYKNSKAYYSRQVLKISDALLWGKISNEWVIGDMIVADHQFEVVVDRIVMLARKLGVRQIQFHASPGTNLHRLFALRYKPGPSFPALFQQFDESVNIHNIKFTLADIDIF